MSIKTAKVKTHLRTSLKTSDKMRQANCQKRPRFPAVGSFYGNNNVFNKNYVFTIGQSTIGPPRGPFYT